MHAPAMLGPTGATGLSKAGSYALPVLGLGASAYFMVSGYQDNGIAGAKDAAVYDLATTSAIAAMYSPDPRAPGTLRTAPNRGFCWNGAKSNSEFLKGAAKAGGFMRVAIPAGLIGGMGQAIAGTPGAFIGAYAGARMGHAVPTAVMAIGAIGAAAGAEEKRGSAVLKAGYMNRQMRRRIDTAGSKLVYDTECIY